MEENKKYLAIFEGNQIRRFWDEDKELWYFSVVDVIAVLTNSVDPLAYWRKLKERLIKEGGNETVTKCHALKMLALDGKMRLTDAADTETLFRLIQSIPSPKAEPFKRWLARVGKERLDEVWPLWEAAATSPGTRAVRVTVGANLGDLGATPITKILPSNCGRGRTSCATDLP